MTPTVLEYIIGAILLVLAVAIIVLISLQQSKRRGLGNSIAGNGASESYLTKNKIATNEKKQQKWTLVLSIVFVVLVLALYIVHSNGIGTGKSESSSAAESSVADVSAK
jgi:protein translocase SecG subunit